MELFDRLIGHSREDAGALPVTVYWCPTCWRRYELESARLRSQWSPVVGRECWACYDGQRQLWRDAFYRPDSVPAWMRQRPWEPAA